MSIFGRPFSGHLRQICIAYLHIAFHPKESQSAILGQEVNENKQYEIKYHHRIKITCYQFKIQGECCLRGM